METLQIGTTTKLVPSTWNELGRKRLLKLLPQVLSPIHGPDRRMRLLSTLTGFSLPLLCALADDVLAQLLPLTNFLEADDQLLTAQLLPTLQVPGRHVTEPALTWHGPRAHLSNVSFGEFIFADTFFVQYALHGRPAHLDKFLAVLYRPVRRKASPDDDDWNGDLRVAFNEHHLELRTARAARIDDLEKLAVLTWYRGCRTQLAQEFPDVFTAAEEADAGPKKAPQWERVLRKLAGGAFGAVQQTAAQPLRLLLAEMQDAAVEYQRLKSAQQKPVF